MNDMFWQNDDTPLHLASKNNNIDVIKLLLDHGGDINAKGYVRSIILCECCYMFNICAITKS